MTVLVPIALRNEFLKFFMWKIKPMGTSRRGSVWWDGTGVRCKYQSWPTNKVKNSNKRTTRLDKAEFFTSGHFRDMPFCTNLSTQLRTSIHRRSYIDKG